MTREAGERSFDELAIGLASGRVSRREALKWLGAALLGGALAFTPKVAEARKCPPGLKSCLALCINPTTEFCCKGPHNATRCLRGTEQCCITQGSAVCQPLDSACIGRVRVPH
jgi:hypothetical protein